MGASGKRDRGDGAYTHMLDGQPRLFCMHFWTNDIQKLARGLQAALNKIKVAKSGSATHVKRSSSPRATWAKLRQRCSVHSTVKRKGMGSEATETSQKSQGVFVTYSPQEHGYRDSHERVTRTEIGRRLAALKRYAFAGEYDCSVCYSGPGVFHPERYTARPRGNRSRDQERARPVGRRRAAWLCGD